MDKIIIGKITKPQGIKGEVKILPLTDDAGRFEGLAGVYVGAETEKRRVLSLRVSHDGVFMLLGGVTGRSAAELLRGLYIALDKEEAVTLEAGRFFIEELKGCGVYDEGGGFLGTVSDVLQHGAADVFEVAGGEKPFLFPFIDGVLKTADVKNKRLVVSAVRFAEVVTYED